MPITSKNSVSYHVIRNNPTISIGIHDRIINVPKVLSLKFSDNLLVAEEAYSINRP